MVRTDKKGSATVETAITLPLFISVLLLFSSFLVCIASINSVYSALYKTASFFSDYGYIYHEKGIKKVEDSLLKDIVRLVDDNESSLILKQADMRQLAEGADNYLYGEIAKSIFMQYLNEENVVKSGLVKLDKVTFSGSSFFDHGDDVILVARCVMKLPLPAPEKLIEGFEIRGKLRFRCFINGEMGSYNEAAPVEASVWSLSNFERGRIIRQVFGANLPSNYPVIAKFDNGKATMIKSLDHTAKTYQDANIFKTTIKNMVLELAQFNGRDYGGVSIKPGDIKRRELLLVMPTNELTPQQEFALMEISSYCLAKNVVLIVERYQEKK
ncbi:MAG: hypothetical protein GX166_07050 [Clostridiaceae bacterium]|nr:hypothetical protein [Clostridiaceae bacterium]